MLLRTLESKEPLPPEHVLIPFQLVARESSKAVAG